MVNIRKVHLSASILFLAVGVFACSGGAKKPLVRFPDQLAGLELQRELRGKEAAKMIAQLHGKEVSPEESYVAFYGQKNPPTVLYVSVFADSNQASAFLQRMSQKIGKGAYGFGHHGQFQVRNLSVEFVLGYGQVHFFFARGEKLYWLAIDGDRAQQGLADVLKVPVKEVKSPDEFLGEFFRSMQQ